jgi:hypothetical protein
MLGSWDHFAACGFPPAVAGQQLGEHVPEYPYNNRTVGRGVFYAVRVVSSLEYVVKEKQAINSSQNLFYG